MAETAAQHFQAGRLTDAIAAAIQTIKSKPTDLDTRGLLADLQCFAGNLEKADTQLDTLSTQNPETGLVVAMLRQIIRGEQARQQLIADGRLPEFIEGTAPEHMRLKLEAVMHLREGRTAEAAAACEKAEELRPPLAGTHDEASFDDFRDLDDLFGGMFEVITSTGKYFWIPAENVETISFHAPERPRDLLWRRASMSVRGGPDGEVFLPVIYPGLSADAAEGVRLGRVTEWTEEEGAPIRGVGQRSFLVGDECVPIMQLGTLTFGAAS